MTRSKILRAVFVIAIALANLTAWADTAFALKQIGDRFMLSNADRPAIAALKDGGTVIAWSAGSEIWAQRLDANGQFVGSSFLVPGLAGSGGDWPSVAGLSDGGFIVVWQSSNPDIQALRYDAAGLPVGQTFLVEGGIRLQFPLLPKVAALVGGGFVITWERTRPTSVFARIYDATATAQGDPFKVNTYSWNAQDSPSVAGLADGGFVIVWDSQEQDGAPGFGVYGQRYDGAGTPIGTEFRVNTNTVGYQLVGGIAALTDGGFVVVWQSDHTGQYNVYGQRYNSAGGMVRGEFQINTAAPAYSPQVTSTPAGGFIVAFASSSVPYGQSFRLNGSARGSNFPLTRTRPGGVLDLPTVAAPTGGNVIAVWGKVNESDTRASIFGQAFAP